jgi:hypothetical protein
LIATGPLSVTCFRYAPKGVDDVVALTKRLLEKVQADGKTFLTSTDLNGQYALRACVVNFRTTEADMDALLDILAEAGQRVISEQAALGK